MNTFKQIAWAVRCQLGFNLAVLRGAGRHARLAEARQVAYYLAYQQGYTYKEIAEFFKRDNSTVWAGVDKIGRMHHLPANKLLGPLLDELERISRKEVVR